VKRTFRLCWLLTSARAMNRVTCCADSSNTRWFLSCNKWHSQKPIQSQINLITLNHMLTSGNLLIRKTYPRSSAIKANPTDWQWDWIYYRKNLHHKILEKYFLWASVNAHYMLHYYCTIISTDFIQSVKWMHSVKLMTHWPFFWCLFLMTETMTHFASIWYRRLSIALFFKILPW